MVLETLIVGTDTVAGCKTRWIEMQRNILKHGRPVINKTGGALTCFKAVAQAGHDTTSDLPTIELCTAAKFKYLLGLLVAEELGGESTVANNALGLICDEGYVNFDTSGFSAVDVPLWISGSGDLSETANAGLPPIAIVKVKAVAGSGGCVYFNRNGVYQESAEKRSHSIRLGGISATALTRNEYVMAAPGKCRITRAYLLSDTATAGSTGAAEYRFMLRNTSDSLDLMSASKVTSTAELAVGTVYDLVVNQNQNLSATDKILRLQITTVGTPATSLAAANVTLVIEWQPVP